MAVRPGFSIEAFSRQLQKKREGVERVIVMRFRLIGEQFVVNARSNDTYRDRTANLRSSIGYVILKDGVPLESVFPGEKGEGKAEGAKLVEALSSRYARGYVLIVVAGMDYALAVESKGYDVLTASSIVAERELKAAIVTIQNKAA